MNKSSWTYEEEADVVMVNLDITCVHASRHIAKRSEESEQLPYTST
jgi:hypothetical protein